MSETDTKILQPISEKHSRRALDPPATAVTLLTNDLLGLAQNTARSSSRSRVILPLHKSAGDPLQRMLNAMEPGTYVQPHRHSSPPKAESIVVLAGAICFVMFDEQGNVNLMQDIVAGSPTFGIDVDAGVYHTFLPLVSGTVVFEAKPGPYSAADDKDFADWAPKEGSEGVVCYLEMLSRLREKTGNR
jgi:cupin fold WbuC family metalloprotein